MFNNDVTEGDGFWVSYNSSTFTGDGEETALCQHKRPYYLILAGDYRKDLVPLVKEGYEKCLERLKQLVSDGVQMSDWSEEISS